jgi:hypothetical protein
MPDSSIAPNETSEPPKQQWRFVDLSLADDRNYRPYCLVGILDYCCLLRDYKNVVGSLRRAERTARVVGSDSWKSLDPVTQAYDKAQIEQVNVWRNACGGYWADLRDLCEAALGLMPEVTPKLKVLRFGPVRMETVNDPDWQGFEDDLAAISAQTRVLKRQLEEKQWVDAQAGMVSPTPAGNRAEVVKPGNGERSLPMSIVDLATRLGIPDRKAKTILKSYDLQNFDGNRQLWTVSFDRMPPNHRRQIESK